MSANLKPYNMRLKPTSRTLRTHMTDAELLLWKRLRCKQVEGVQFYRQKPLLEYIVDFYCPVAQLVIEVDGGHHFEAEQSAHDAKRDNGLQKVGLTTLRFDNRQVLLETDAVMEAIRQAVVAGVRKRSEKS